MARDLGASCRKCRREGEKLFLKGARCFSIKCAITKREYAPGQHGARKPKLSNFGLQMREKQKVKRIYGLLERQFRGYFAKATRSKGITGTVLLQMLERRLDNVIYQSGFATSRKEARQIVGHGFVLVNDRHVNIPSFLVKKDDELTVNSTNNDLKFIKENIEASKERAVPVWLNVDPEHRRIKVVRFPEREDIQYTINEQLIVELYSR